MQQSAMHPRLSLVSQFSSISFAQRNEDARARAREGLPFVALLPSSLLLFALLTFVCVGGIVF